MFVRQFTLDSTDEMDQFLRVGIVRYISGFGDVHRWGAPHLPSFAFGPDCVGSVYLAKNKDTLLPYFLNYPGAEISTSVGALVALQGSYRRFGVEALGRSIRAPLAKAKIFLAGVSEKKLVERPQ